MKDAKIVINNDRIIGCIMLGDKKGFNRIIKAIHEKHYASEVLNEERCINLTL